jgi:PPOX class probable F420-dependent enzyme
MFTVDTSTEFGKRVAERLRDDVIVWLTTIDSKGTPQPRPVWFHWDGQSIVIYTRAEGHKLRHIQRNPRVALHFDSDGEGGDIVVFTGTAQIDNAAPRVEGNQGYLDKYLPLITGRIQSDIERFKRAYSVAIRVTPDEVRGG